MERSFRQLDCVCDSLWNWRLKRSSQSIESNCMKKVAKLSWKLCSDGPTFQRLTRSTFIRYMLATAFSMNHNHKTRQMVERLPVENSTSRVESRASGRIRKQCLSNTGNCRDSATCDYPVTCHMRATWIPTSIDSWNPLEEPWTSSAFQ